MSDIVPTPVRIFRRNGKYISAKFDGIEEPNAEIALIHGVVGDVKLTIDDDVYDIDIMRWSQLDMLNPDACDVEIELK